MNFKFQCSQFSERHRGFFRAFMNFIGFFAFVVKIAGGFDFTDI